MDVILLERVAKLGAMGDTVTVKDGYARNFLLPNKKALRANAANKQVFEANRERLETENAEKREIAKTHSTSIDGKQIILIRAASNSGQLYGSVAVRDIVEELNKDDAGLDKSMVVLERPIKTLGLFDVRIALHPEVSVTVQVNVARSEDEAEMQKDGIDVMAQMFDNEADAGFVEAFDPNAEPGALPGEGGEEGEAEAGENAGDADADAAEAAQDDTQDA